MNLRHILVVTTGCLEEVGNLNDGSTVAVVTSESSVIAY